MTIVSAAWSLTVGGVSSGVGPTFWGAAGTNDETGAIIGDDTEDASVLVGARLTPTTGAKLFGKMLESTELLL